MAEGGGWGDSRRSRDCFRVRGGDCDDGGGDKGIGFAIPEGRKTGLGVADATAGAVDARLLATLPEDALVASLPRLFEEGVWWGEG